MTDSPSWWNGLLYSRWQLLGVGSLRHRLAGIRHVRRGQAWHPVLSPATELASTHSTRVRDRAKVLTALDARFLPVLDPERVHLSGAEIDDWERYRDTFDPVAIAAELRIDAAYAAAEAEQLLASARCLDPSGNWSELIRRAPRDKWKTLSGDLLLAMEHRIAAEILLRFVEELAGCGAADPVPAPPPMNWHPLHERLTARSEVPLDDVLSELGVSPHPRLILVVEGETEELLFPRVFDALGLRRSPDLVRILCMRGIDQRLALVAAFAAAPLLGERRGDAYELIRPPTALLVAVDREKRFKTDQDVARQRTIIIEEINRVIAAQGAELDPGDVEALVQIRTWNAKCFEYAHFDDAELATGLRACHPNCGGMDDAHLKAAIGQHRAAGDDIGRVWKGWRPQVAKPALAESLWPALQRGIQAAVAGLGPAPAAAEVAQEAYERAQSWSRGRLLMRGIAADPTTDGTGE